MSDGALPLEEPRFAPLGAGEGEDARAEGGSAAPRSRAILLRRLADVVCLPGSRVNAFERAMTADLLVEMLQAADVEERARVARRLAVLAEIPPVLTRMLLRSEFQVACELLEHSLALTDPDLIDCVRLTTPEHRLLIAQRRNVSEVICDALVETGDEVAIDMLLRNEQAHLSHAALELLVARAGDNARLVPLLLRRSELRPGHAYVLFWWADADARRLILQRFAVSREVLQDAVGDLFSIMADEGWIDEIGAKAMMFIERRQRDRKAPSRFESLDAAIEAADAGLTRELAEEIAVLSGLRPATGARIFLDPGGEPMAILCKATGLPRTALRTLWRGMRRPETTEEGELTAALERVLIAYDMIAVDRAQTVLRYWNWALTSARTPALLQAANSDYSPAARNGLASSAAEFTS